MVLHRLYMQQIISFTSVYQDMKQGEVSFCIDSYTLLNQYESGDKPLPNNGSVLKPSCKPILLSTQFHKPI